MACGPPQPPWVTAFDPLAALPLAEVRQESARLQPPAGNAGRAAGWIPGDGDGPRLSRGRAAELETWLVSPRPLTLQVRAALADAAGGSQAVAVAVNGTRVGEIALTGAVREARVALPAEVLRAGVNQVRFEHPWAVRRPRRGDDGAGRDGGRRQLAVAWHDLRLDVARGDGAPRRDGDGLLLPVGARVDWFFPVTGAAVLELPGVSGPEGARLQVVAQAAGGEEQELAVIEPGGRRRWLELPVGRESLHRLALAATPAAGATATGALRVEAPRVLGREGAPAAAERGAAPPAASAGRAAAVADRSRSSASGRPSILLYLVDTLRADRLGAYGSRRGLTPSFDRLAAEGTVFRRTVAQAPWTRPSVATLFTGMGPLRHAVTRLEHRLPAAAVTLAERLRDAGYDTAAVSSNAHVTRATGLTQGFQHVQFLPRQPAAEVVHRLATEWLESRRDAAPYLLYLHVLEPHAPYSPPADLRARYAPEAPPAAGSRAWLERLYRARGPARRELAAPLPALYDGEVAAADRAFGDLRQALEERGEWDRLLVVVVSDHGEGLGERGVVGHAQDLYQEAIAVPLIVKWPGERRGRRVDALAQHVDVLPTLLAAAGLPAPPEATGVDLATLGAAAGAGERAAISHLDYRGRAGMSAVWGRWKWIEPLTTRFAAAPELYDLAADPGETRDLAAAEPVVAGWLRTLLRAERLAAATGSEQAELDAETREALGALGYL